MPCLRQWWTSRRRSWDRRSIISLRLVYCFGRACRRIRPICLSMPLSKMLHMGLCCASHDARSTPASLRRSRTNSRRLLKANRSCSLNIATLPSGPRRPLFTGAQQASRLRTAQPMSKQSSIFAARCFAMLSEPRVPTVCAPNLQFCPSSGRH
jgi:hypothetical protein